MQSLRTILRDALTRKMHALLSTLSFDEQEHAVIVEAHYEEMQRWCNVEKDDYLQYRLATWKKESGKALKTLLTIAKEYDTKKHVVSERKVREELLKLYEEFGWDHLVDNEKRFIQMHYPRN
jgi:predicted amino acid-binding ACT domain protein